MDELHAAIATYLRGHRRHAERRRQARESIPLELEVTFFPAPRCLICGRTVDDDGGLFNLADMQLRRQCEQHYCPF